MSLSKNSDNQVAILMGSASDWETMSHAAAILDEFDVGYERRVVSAHRMPDDMFAFADQAQARGLRAIIAGAGGAAHLPGMLAAKTAVPVLGVPVASKHLQGLDSLYSIVQMPKGVPVATFAIGPAGAANAALFAVAMLAAKTIVPVLGVPVASKQLSGVDSLYSIVQMPRGVPVATFAIGPSGAANAALFAVAMLAAHDEALRQRLVDFRAEQTAAARAMTQDLQ